jgi:hypothetical protein
MLTYLIIKRRTWSGKPIVPYDLVRLKEVSSKDGIIGLDVDEHIFIGWTPALITENTLKIFPLKVPEGILTGQDEYVIMREDFFKILEEKDTNKIVQAFQDHEETVIFQFIQAEDDEGAELFFRMKGYDGYER